MFDQTITYLNDKDIARQVGLTSGWVKNQRFKRRHGEPHAFTVDPIQIGSVPRYRASDIQSWLENLGKQTMGPT